jgi:hypothetical protein
MTTPPTDNSATPEVRLPAAGPGQMWGWRNWQAWEAGYSPLGAVEYRLYTDCDLLSGEATEGLGPYRLFKTGTFVLTIGTVLPAVVLRANHYIYPALVLGGARGNSLELNIDTLRLVGTVDDKRNELSEDTPRNVDAYHGGHVADHRRLGRSQLAIDAIRKVADCGYLLLDLRHPQAMRGPRCRWEPYGRQRHTPPRFMTRTLNQGP